MARKGDAREQRAKPVPPRARERLRICSRPTTYPHHPAFPPFLHHLRSPCKLSAWRVPESLSAPSTSSAHVASLPPQPTQTPARHPPPLLLPSLFPTSRPSGNVSRPRSSSQSTNSLRSSRKETGRHYPLTRGRLVRIFSMPPCFLQITNSLRYLAFKTRATTFELCLPLYVSGS